MAADELADVLRQVETERPEVADELRAVQAIYGDEALTLAEPWSGALDRERLLQLKLTISSTTQDTEQKQSFLIKLPPGYPATEQPRVEALGKDSGTFDDANIWQPGLPAIFDCVEKARESCERQLDTSERPPASVKAIGGAFSNAASPATNSAAPLSTPKVQLKHPLYSSQPIVDRKSVFVGHACRIEGPGDVQAVVATLLADKKIAKAAHPAMLAYRCRGAGGVLYRDNDDDGETAAGSRLSHLLQVLDLEDVLVVVTRWYGGIHLGSDRFKRINDAARQALLEAELIKK